jgi:hypothetical protein
VVPKRIDAANVPSSGRRTLSGGSKFEPKISLSLKSVVSKSEMTEKKQTEMKKEEQISVAVVAIKAKEASNKNEGFASISPVKKIKKQSATKATPEEQPPIMEGPAKQSKSSRINLETDQPSVSSTQERPAIKKKRSPLIVESVVAPIVDEVSDDIVSEATTEGLKKKKKKKAVVATDDESEQAAPKKKVVKKVSTGRAKELLG